MNLVPFQGQFLEAAFADEVRLAVLSLPRGNGKSSLAGHVLARCMTPDDDLHQRGAEYLLLAGSLQQARHVFRAMKEELADADGYRWRDSSMQLGVTRKACGTSVRVHSSNGKTAMGIVGVPLAVADEPGSWEVAGGQLMYDGLTTAQGKPDSDLRVLMIGTVAPAMVGWWPDLVTAGSGPGRHVHAIQGDPKKWDDESEIARCNPLMWQYPKSREVLLQERDEALRDSRLKARFLSYRLNLPTADESDTLLMVADWERVMARPGGAQSDMFQTTLKGKPIFAYDLGAGRAWSAAVAIWESGKVEALAVAPGIPSLADQEKRDQVPKGTYAQLHELGVLHVAEGLRVQPPAQLHAAALEAWGRPVTVIADHFRVNELRDVVKECPVESRRTQWSSSAEDIRALRKIAKDGPLACGGNSAKLIVASLTVAKVENDKAGNVRLVKRGTHNEARDDVAAALVLAAGAFMRRIGRPKPRPLRFAVAG